VEQFNAALDRLPREEINRIVNLFVKPKFFIPIWLRWLILSGSLATFLFFVVLLLINKRLARLVDQCTKN